MSTVTWSRTFFAIAAVLLAYVSATTAGNAIESRQLGRQLDSERRTLQREVTTYQTQLDQLTSLRIYLKSDEFVQTVARRELGLTMPGEPLVIIVSPERPPDAANDGVLLGWWQNRLRP